MEHILSWIAFMPLMGVALTLLVPKGQNRALRAVALLTTGSVLALLTWLAFFVFKSSAGGLQFVETHAWIANYNIHFALGVDGLSMVLLWLSALIHFLAVIISESKMAGQRGYYSLLLLLFAGVNGVFLATDLFLFYVYWELMLIPMYFLIGIWGGKNRKLAAGKFLLYTLFGSILMLVAIVAIYLRSGAAGLEPTFDIYALQSQALSWVGAGGEFLGLSFTSWTFSFLFIAFAIKIPIFPFHTWLPDAHVEAPTAISVILAGILLKLGAYGMLRIAFPLAPDAFQSAAWLLATLGVVNIVYGAWVALGQTDFKRLVAYSSISHMGFFLLGAAAVAATGTASANPYADWQGARFNALTGATLQLFTHGLSAALMFMVVGVVYKRAKHRDLGNLGGLARSMPNFYKIATVAIFASLGMPLLSGFVPEALTLFGSWAVWPWHVVLAGLGLLLTAAFLIQAHQRVFMGAASAATARYPDLDRREWCAMLPLGILCILLGVAPWLVLDGLAATMKVVLGTLSGGPAR
jgi:NADH-quinone oxidoreductase subunit M